jgi:hypothetical protein
MQPGPRHHQHARSRHPCSVSHVTAHLLCASKISRAAFLHMPSAPSSDVYYCQRELELRRVRSRIPAGSLPKASAAAAVYKQRHPLCFPPSLAQAYP